MHVSFATAAYIAGTSNELLDKLDRSPLSTSATGEEIVVITTEAITEALTDYEASKETPEQNIDDCLANFLKEAMQKIKCKNVGDVFFTS